MLVQMLTTRGVMLVNPGGPVPPCQLPKGPCFRVLLGVCMRGDLGTILLLLLVVVFVLLLLLW